jgi:hypothetical protein
MAEPNQAGADAPGLLMAMRHVVTWPSVKDRVQLHRVCRLWLENDRKGFLSKLADMEKALLAFQQKRAPTGPGDGGSSPAPSERELFEDRIDELIQEEETRLAEEDASLALQPGAAQQGRALQEELKAALWRERQLREKAKAGGPWSLADPFENQLMRILDDARADLRARDCELAIHPEPGKVLASLQHALKSTAERLVQEGAGA